MKKLFIKLLSMIFVLSSAFSLATLSYSKVSASETYGLTVNDGVQVKLVDDRDGVPGLRFNATLKESFVTGDLGLTKDSETGTWSKQVDFGIQVSVGGNNPIFISYLSTVPGGRVGFSSTLRFEDVADASYDYYGIVTFNKDELVKSYEEKYGAGSATQAIIDKYMLQALSMNLTAQAYYQVEGQEIVTVGKQVTRSLQDSALATTVKDPSFDVSNYYMAVKQAENDAFMKNAENVENGTFANFDFEGKGVYRVLETNAEGKLVAPAGVTVNAGQVTFGEEFINAKQVGESSTLFAYVAPTANETYTTVYMIDYVVTENFIRSADEFINVFQIDNDYGEATVITRKNNAGTMIDIEYRQLRGHYALVNSIDMAGKAITHSRYVARGYNPSATTHRNSGLESAFYGSFDGCGYSILNFEAKSNSAGLFGGVGLGASIKNVGLVNVRASNSVILASYLAGNYGETVTTYEDIYVHVSDDTIQPKGLANAVTVHVDVNPEDNAWITSTSVTFKNLVVYYANDITSHGTTGKYVDNVPTQSVGILAPALDNASGTKDSVNTYFITPYVLTWQLSGTPNGGNNIDALAGFRYGSNEAPSTVNPVAKKIMVVEGVGEDGKPTSMRPFTYDDKYLIRHTGADTSVPEQDLALVDEFGNFVEYVAAPASNPSKLNPNTEAYLGIKRYSNYVAMENDAEANNGEASANFDLSLFGDNWQVKNGVPFWKTGYSEIAIIKLTSDKDGAQTSNYTIESVGDNKTISIVDPYGNDVENFEVTLLDKAATYLSYEQGALTYVKASPEDEVVFVKITSESAGIDRIVAITVTGGGYEDVDNEVVYSEKDSELRINDLGLIGTVTKISYEDSEGNLYPLTYEDGKLSGIEISIVSSSASSDDLIISSATITVTPAEGESISVPCTIKNEEIATRISLIVVTSDKYYRLTNVLPATKVIDEVSELNVTKDVNATGADAQTGAYVSTDEYFVLDGDIDASATAITSSAVGVLYGSVIDGRGYKITNLTLNNVEGIFANVFRSDGASTQTKGFVQNIALVNVTANNSTLLGKYVRYTGITNSYIQINPASINYKGLFSGTERQPTTGNFTYYDNNLTHQGVLYVHNSVIEYLNANAEEKYGVFSAKDTSLVTAAKSNNNFFITSSALSNGGTYNNDTKNKVEQAIKSKYSDVTDYSSYISSVGDGWQIYHKTNAETELNLVYADRHSDTNFRYNDYQEFKANVSESVGVVNALVTNSNGLYVKNADGIPVWHDSSVYNTVAGYEIAGQTNNVIITKKGEYDVSVVNPFGVKYEISAVESTIEGVSYENGKLSVTSISMGLEECELTVSLVGGAKVVIPVTFGANKTLSAIVNETITAKGEYEIAVKDEELASYTITSVESDSNYVTYEGGSLKVTGIPLESQIVNLVITIDEYLGEIETSFTLGANVTLNAEISGLSEGKIVKAGEYAIAVKDGNSASYTITNVVSDNNVVTYENGKLIVSSVTDQEIVVNLTITVDEFIGSITTSVTLVKTTPTISEEVLYSEIDKELRIADYTTNTITSAYYVDANGVEHELNVVDGKLDGITPYVTTVGADSYMNLNSSTLTITPKTGDAITITNKINGSLYTGRITIRVVAGEHEFKFTNVHPATKVIDQASEINVSSDGAEVLNKYYVFGGDIDASNYTFTSALGTVTQCIIEGNGHSITGIVLNSVNGIFANILKGTSADGGNSLIQNLAMPNVVANSSFVIAGRLLYSGLKNCYVQISPNSTNYGGLSQTGASQGTYRILNSIIEYTGKSSAYSTLLVPTTQNGLLAKVARTFFISPYALSKNATVTNTAGVDVYTDARNIAKELDPSAFSTDETNTVQPTGWSYTATSWGGDYYSATHKVAYSIRNRDTNFRFTSYSDFVDNLNTQVLVTGEKVVSAYVNEFIEYSNGMFTLSDEGYPVWHDETVYNTVAGYEIAGQTGNVNITEKGEYDVSITNNLGKKLSISSIETTTEGISYENGKLKVTKLPYKAEEINLTINLASGGTTVIPVTFGANKTLSAIVNETITAKGEYEIAVKDENLVSYTITSVETDSDYVTYEDGSLKVTGVPLESQTVNLVITIDEYVGEIETSFTLGANVTLNAEISGLSEGKIVKAGEYAIAVKDGNSVSYTITNVVSDNNVVTYENGKLIVSSVTDQEIVVNLTITVDEFIGSIKTSVTLVKTATIISNDVVYSEKDSELRIADLGIGEIASVYYVDKQGAKHELSYENGKLTGISISIYSSTNSSYSVGIYSATITVTPKQGDAIEIACSSLGSTIGDRIALLVSDVNGNEYKLTSVLPATKVIDEVSELNVTKDSEGAGYDSTGEYFVLDGDIDASTTTITTSAVGRMTSSAIDGRGYKITNLTLENVNGIFTSDFYGTGAYSYGASSTDKQPSIVNLAIVNVTANNSSIISNFMRWAGLTNVYIQISPASVGYKGLSVSVGNAGAGMLISTTIIEFLNENNNVKDDLLVNVQTVGYFTSRSRNALFITSSYLGKANSTIHIDTTNKMIEANGGTEEGITKNTAWQSTWTSTGAASNIVACSYLQDKLKRYTTYSELKANVNNTETANIITALTATGYFNKNSNGIPVWYDETVYNTVASYEIAGQTGNVNITEKGEYDVSVVNSLGNELSISSIETTVEGISYEGGKLKVTKLPYKVEEINLTINLVGGGKVVVPVTLGANVTMAVEIAGVQEGAEISQVGDYSLAVKHDLTEYTITSVESDSNYVTYEGGSLKVTGVPLESQIVNLVITIDEYVGEIETSFTLGANVTLNAEISGLYEGKVIRAGEYAIAVKDESSVAYTITNVVSDNDAVTYENGKLVVSSVTEEETVANLTITVNEFVGTITTSVTLVKVVPTISEEVLYSQKDNELRVADLGIGKITTAYYEDAEGTLHELNVDENGNLTGISISITSAASSNFLKITAGTITVTPKQGDAIQIACAKLTTTVGDRITLVVTDVNGNEYKLTNVLPATKVIDEVGELNVTKNSEGAGYASTGEYFVLAGDIDASTTAITTSAVGSLEGSTIDGRGYSVTNLTLENVNGIFTERIWGADAGGGARGIVSNIALKNVTANNSSILTRAVRWAGIINSYIQINPASEGFKGLVVGAYNPNNGLFSDTVLLNGGALYVQNTVVEYLNAENETKANVVANSDSTYATLARSQNSFFVTSSYISSYGSYAIDTMNKVHEAIAKAKEQNSELTGAIESYVANSNPAAPTGWQTYWTTSAETGLSLRYAQYLKEINFRYSDYTEFEAHATNCASSVTALVNASNGFFANVNGVPVWQGANA